MELKFQLARAAVELKNHVDNGTKPSFGYPLMNFEGKDQAGKFNQWSKLYKEAIAQPKSLFSNFKEALSLRV